MGNRQQVFKTTIKMTLALLLVSIVVSSCKVSTSKSSRTRVSANNSNSSLTSTQGRVLLDNPIILSKNANLSVDADLNLLVSVPVAITAETFLQGLPGGCSEQTHCFEVRETRESASPLQTTDGKWGFNASSSQFLQVNTFYHMNKIFSQFVTNLGQSLDFYKAPLTSDFKDLSAIPESSRSSLDGSFALSPQKLYAFANCDVSDNAYYDQSSESLCFGHSGSTKKLRWAQDSTIIYHETGHFFQKVQLNLRNPGLGPKAQLGNNLYTEAGAIGEGLSDFFSYYVNGRTHWGEWAAGKLKGSRPLTESDGIHAPGISSEDDQRLSYPQYINYDPNYPTDPIEDIHMSGMIISHYLVALTNDIESKCSMSNLDAREYVMYVVTETMAELGDFTTYGTNSGLVNKVNMNASYAPLWFNTVNPINYRSFTQTIAKNLYNTIGNSTLGRCNGSYYSKDYIETLLDNYGLLLFKTYNQDRNSTVGSTVKTSVSLTNRKKSEMISRSNIMLDPTSGASAAFVIDNRAQIQAGVTQLQSSGLIGTLSTLTPSNFNLNNGNSKVSPGEVVAIALNLYNNSNSTMGGIEVLANDWDHAEAATGRPCRFGTTSTSSDLWPLETEGGSVDASCSDIQASTDADFAPVCFVQYNDTTATKWISQKEFMTKISGNENECLDKTNGGKDCFIRAIKGADKAYFSKIAPKKTWGQTMAHPTTGKAYSLDWGNVILFEISKHIPQGTVVDCRMRVRFTNCEDCYHDSTRNNNDFYDRQYNGPTPYKMIHLQIPITD